MKRYIIVCITAFTVLFASSFAWADVDAEVYTAFGNYVNGKISDQDLMAACDAAIKNKKNLKESTLKLAYDARSRLYAQSNNRKAALADAKSLEKLDPEKGGVYVFVKYEIDDKKYANAAKRLSARVKLLKDSATKNALPNVASAIDSKNYSPEVKKQIGNCLVAPLGAVQTMELFKKTFFVKNSAIKDKHYAGKNILFHGNITEITASPKDETVLRFRDREYAVSFHFKAIDGPAFVKLKPGDEVTVMGICAKNYMIRPDGFADVIMSDAVLIK